MDYPTVHEYGPLDDLDGLDGFIDPEMLRDAIPAAMGGTGSGILFHVAANFTVKRDIDGETVEEPFLDKPWKRGIAALLMGFAGGLGLWHVHRSAAMGFMGGMSSQFGSEVVRLVLEKMAEREAEAAGSDSGTEGFGFGPSEADLEAEAALMGGRFAGLGSPLPEEQELLGLGEPVIEERYANGFAQVEVDELDPRVAASFMG